MIPHEYIEELTRRTDIVELEQPVRTTKTFKPAIPVFTH